MTLLETYKISIILLISAIGKKIMNHSVIKLRKVLGKFEDETPKKFLDKGLQLFAK